MEKFVPIAMALMIAGGCGCKEALVLESGEKVESLYYHECRMPEEVMVEMWIDFDSRRLRFKYGLHDAFGWESRRFDSMRLDLMLGDEEWRSVVRHVLQANVEAWPDANANASVSPSDTTSYYLRLCMAGRTVEKFAVCTPPDGFDGIQSVVRFAMSHEALRLWRGE